MIRFIVGFVLAVLTSAAAAQIRDPLDAGLDLEMEKPAAVAWDEISYGSDHKDKIHRVVSRRPGMLPMIIELEAHSAFDEEDDYQTDWLPSWFVERGFAHSVVSPRFNKNNTGRVHAGKLADGIAEVIRRAERHGYDASRLVLMGKGWGGQMAALLATDPTWLEAAGVNFASVRGVIILNGSGFNLPALLQEATKRQREQIEKQVNGDEKAATALSPLHHADRPNVPIFLFHALSDHQKRLAEAETLAAALRQAGARADVKIVPRSRWQSLASFIGHPRHRETQPLLDFLKEATR